MERCIILHNVRSAHNVGSIFRTAEGAGAARVFLVGYTPTPIDRFGRTQPEIEKTSLGATRMLPWEYHENAEPLVESLREAGYEIVSIEQHEDAKPHNTFEQKKNTAYIFGNEVEGVPETLIKCSDTALYIPMRGKKESLNVSVAVGVILFNTD